MSKGRRKCAVSDFDRTLYVDEQVSLRNRQAVKAWQAAGYPFVIATGRNEASVSEKLREAGLEPDALILNNGALILDRDRRELFCRTIDPDTVREVLTFLHHVSDDGSGVSTRTSKINVLSAAHTTTQKSCDGELAFEQIGQLRDFYQESCGAVMLEDESMGVYRRMVEIEE